MLNLLAWQVAPARSSPLFCFHSSSSLWAWDTRVNIRGYRWACCRSTLISSSWSIWESRVESLNQRWSSWVTREICTRRSMTRFVCRGNCPNLVLWALLFLNIQIKKIFFFTFLKFKLFSLPLECLFLELRFLGALA